MDYANPFLAHQPAHDRALAKLREHLVRQPKRRLRDAPWKPQADPEEQLVQQQVLNEEESLKVIREQGLKLNPCARVGHQPDIDPSRPQHSEIVVRKNGLAAKPLGNILRNNADRHADVTTVQLEYAPLEG